MKRDSLLDGQPNRSIRLSAVLGLDQRQVDQLGNF